MILWLDDIRNPEQFGFIGATWAKNYDEAIVLLKSGDVTFASLDHDIGACQTCIEKGLHIGIMNSPETTFFNRCPHMKSGYDVICWMEEHNIWPKNGVRVHSMNPVGRDKMNQVILRQYGRLFN